MKNFIVVPAVILHRVLDKRNNKNYIYNIVT